MDPIHPQWRHRNQVGKAEEGPGREGVVLSSESCSVFLCFLSFFGEWGGKVRGLGWGGLNTRKMARWRRETSALEGRARDSHPRHL
jgi:hypothetical protein